MTEETVTGSIVTGARPKKTKTPTDVNQTWLVESSTDRFPRWWVEWMDSTGGHWRLGSYETPEGDRPFISKFAASEAAAAIAQGRMPRTIHARCPRCNQLRLEWSIERHIETCDGPPPGEHCPECGAGPFTRLSIHMRATHPDPEKLADA